jgi:glycosyltransferase involved in cell wall biosynthesis
MALSEVDRRVHAPGFVNDVRPTLAAARIYVCPITDGGGTRLKILDALSLERALVSTRLGVEGLGLEAERHYLNAETPEEFARQCRRLRDDSELADRLGRQGRSHVLEHYGWGTIGAHLDQAYREAAQGAGTGALALAAPG